MIFEKILGRKKSKNQALGEASCLYLKDPNLMLWTIENKIKCKRVKIMVMAVNVQTTKPNLISNRNENQTKHQNAHGTKSE